MSNPSPKLRFAFTGMLQRELLIAIRTPNDLVNPVLFFIITASLFAIGLGAQKELLTKAAVGIIWVAALLASLLALDRLFRADFENGTLEQMLLSSHPLFIIVLAKIFAHWIITGLPLILLSPLLAEMLILPNQGVWALMFSLMAGTPVLSLIGAVGAALTLGAKSGTLTALLILPLYLPTLIFGTSCVQSALDGFGYSGPLLVLTAFLILFLPLAPIAAVGALRNNLTG